jgi:hypothetical protein
MGDIKVYDKVIVTDALLLNNRYVKELVGVVAIVLKIDRYLETFPYKVEIDNKLYWVEGIPHSSLMEELF